MVSLRPAVSGKRGTVCDALSKGARLRRPLDIQGGMNQVTNPDRQAIVDQALEHLRLAIDLCDAIGETVPACHLQMGFDMLQGYEAAHLGQPIAAGRAH